ncbi:velvet factor-domain-containing protein [Lentinula aciculospora]|uniref:Velvet factor-domain-containing protein n=1 Tax=Lentinula aciculospora TaxID=153920 RepID=A0A9W9AVY5_9AGAR|nr:velvet factor-domain-containing protein [Lentinula aciculospora]
MFNSGIHAHHIHQPGGAYHDRIHQQQSTSRGFENYNSARIGLCSLPIRFECGQFAGKIIRSELCEIQKADLGRKYARVDRRPLDPPPVVTLRFFEVLNEVTSQRERELTFEEIQILGLLCTVDLFPVIDAESHLGSPTGKSGHRKSNSSSTTNSSHYSPISYDSHGYTPGSSVHNLSPTSPTYPIGRPATVSRTHCPGDIVHSVGYNPIIESSKMTDSLVGATFVQPQFIDYEGTRTLIFVFSDLAVKNEGTFLLRYRMFDLFSKAEGHEDRVIQAECYGGTFRVYSTKEFPGLRASTELTKLISRYGIRLNIRETERRRRTKDAHTETPSGTRRGKRKQASFDDHEGVEED